MTTSSTSSNNNSSVKVSFQPTTQLSNSNTNSNTNSLNSNHPLTSASMLSSHKYSSSKLISNLGIQSVNSILDLKSINDFTFTHDGKGILVCNNNSVKRYSSTLTSSEDYISLIQINETIEKVIAFPDNFVISGTDSSNQSFIRFYYYNSKSRGQSYSYQHQIKQLHFLRSFQRRYLFSHSIIPKKSVITYANWNQIRVSYFNC